VVVVVLVLEDDLVQSACRTSHHGTCLLDQDEEVRACSVDGLQHLPVEKKYVVSKDKGTTQEHEDRVPDGHDLRTIAAATAFDS
jgi:hypothetical protein